jgi:hypothetical protein
MGRSIPIKALQLSLAAWLYSGAGFGLIFSWSRFILDKYLSGKSINCAGNLSLKGLQNGHWGERFLEMSFPGKA